MSKTALVTGASKRIGKSIVEFLAENGWNIIIHYNFSEKDAKVLLVALSGKYPEQSFGTIKSNLSDKKELAELIPSAISQFGEFQLLVNNASVFSSGYIKETSFELFESQMQVNLKAPFILIRDFANYCKNGNIINIVDTRVTSNKSNFAAYSLSKKALWELTKMAALEFAPEIRVNAIAPGVTLPPENEDEDYLQNLAKHIPMKTPSGISPMRQASIKILRSL
jgi:pteridine reductase